MALIGSTTRKYTTASTRTVTLSLVMPSWAGTAMATICMLTLAIRSPIGRMAWQPGAAQLGQDLPEPVDDALLVLLYHLERARSRDYPEYDQDHDDGEDCTHRDHLSS